MATVGVKVLANDPLWRRWLCGCI